MAERFFSDSLALNPVPQASWENLGLNYFSLVKQPRKLRQRSCEEGEHEELQLFAGGLPTLPELQGLRGAGEVLLPDPLGSPGCSQIPWIRVQQAGKSLGCFPRDSGNSLGCFPRYSPRRWCCSLRCLLQREPPQVNTTALMKSLPQSLTVFPSPLPSRARSRRTRQPRASSVPLMLPAWSFPSWVWAGQEGSSGEFCWDIPIYTDGLSTPLSNSSL